MYEEGESKISFMLGSDLGRVQRLALVFLKPLNCLRAAFKRV
jgi:hypothetical protein